MHSNVDFCDMIIIAHKRFSARIFLFTGISFLLIVLDIRKNEAKCKEKLVILIDSLLASMNLSFYFVLIENFCHNKVECAS